MTRLLFRAIIINYLGGIRLRFSAGWKLSQSEDIMRVKLQDVMDGIQYSNAKSQFFYYTETGEVVMLMDSVYGIGQDKALMAKIDAHPELYLPLPNEYEVDEYGMMADFVDEVHDAAAAAALLRALDDDHPAGAFSAVVHAYDLDVQWNYCRNNCYGLIARAWCEENNIEYEE